MLTSTVCCSVACAECPGSLTVSTSVPKTKEKPAADLEQDPGNKPVTATPRRSSSMSHEKPTSGSEQPIRPRDLAVLLLASGDLRPRQLARDQQADVTGLLL